jgi:hypothetical protein
MPQIGCTTGALVDSTNRYNTGSYTNSNTADTSTDDSTSATSVTAPDNTVDVPSEDPVSAAVTPIYNVTPVESTTPILFQLPDEDLTGLANGDFIRCSVGLYKTSTTPVTGGTICVDFGFVYNFIGVFKPYSTQHITVPANFDDIGYTKAFYNTEFGPNVTPSFDFDTNKVCRVEFVHQMYDSAAENDENGTYFKTMIENFAVRVYGINTNGLKIGVACAIVSF